MRQDVVPPVGDRRILTAEVNLRQAVQDFYRAFTEATLVIGRERTAELASRFVECDGPPERGSATH
jgi:hypothetical protein